MSLYSGYRGSFASAVPSILICHERGVATTKEAHRVMREANALLPYEGRIVVPSAAMIRFIAWRELGDKSRWGGSPKWRNDGVPEAAPRRVTVIEYDREWTPQDQYREFMGAVA